MNIFQGKRRVNPEQAEPSEGEVSVIATKLTPVHYVLNNEEHKQPRDDEKKKKSCLPSPVSWGVKLGVPKNNMQRKKKETWDLTQHQPMSSICGLNYIEAKQVGTVES